MKTKSKKKNARRIAAAELALRKVERVPALTRSARKAKSRQPARKDQNDLLINSILSDTLLAGARIPAQVVQPYTQMRFNFRSQLSSGATCEAKCLLNPHLLFTNNFLYDKFYNNTEAYNYVPTAFVNGTATANGYWPNAAAASAAALSAPNQYTTAGIEGYGGQVRVHGVRFRITYNGTDLNKGGVIHVFHNTSHVSPIYPDDTITGSTQNFYSSTTALDRLLAQNSDVTTHHIGDSIEWVWRPQHFEFKEVASVLSMSSVTTTAANTLANNSMPASMGYLPDDGALGTPCPNGWNAGFWLVPAYNYGAGATIPYYLEIEAILDVNLHKIDGAAPWPPGTITVPTAVAHCDPVKTAKIHNALGRLHLARTLHEIAPSAKKLGVAGVKSVAAGAAMSFGESIASSVGAAF